MPSVAHMITPEEARKYSEDGRRRLAATKREEEDRSAVYKRHIYLSVIPAITQEIEKGIIDKAMILGMNSVIFSASVYEGERLDALRIMGYLLADKGFKTELTKHEMTGVMGETYYNLKISW